MNAQVSQDQDWKRDIGTARVQVRTIYQMQKLRIQVGNRVASNFRSKLGYTNSDAQLNDPEKNTADTVTGHDEPDEQEKNILDTLRKDYERITDGIVNEYNELSNRLPTPRKFKGVGAITTYAELLLVDSYIGLLRNEERHFRDLDKLLTAVPVYVNWMKKVPGLGPAMAGALISEIDIGKATYSSSLHKLAGVDTVTVYYYKDNDGKEVLVPREKIEEIDMSNPDLLLWNKRRVFEKRVGRTRQDHSLEMRAYRTKDGEEGLKRSITFSPFLKTKLLGVLGPSFLKQTTYLVDGEPMGTKRRLDLAVSKGFKPIKSENTEDTVSAQVVTFLRLLGHEVEMNSEGYGKIYYDYKHRLNQTPRHRDKSAMHKHRMALRYMIKIFLNDLYAAWRESEGYPVHPPYHEAKLGIYHHKQNPAT